MLPSNNIKKRLITGIIAIIIGFTAIISGGWVFFAFVLVLSVLASLEFDYLRKDNFSSIFLAALPILTARNIELSLILTLIALLFPLFAKKFWLAGSVLYITIPAIALIWLREQPHGLEAVFWLVTVVVATDIGAYIVGKLYGKKKLAPTISPNKTWEGLIGGVALASILSFFLTWDFTFIIIGAVFAVIEQCSDLMESAIKRHYGVKDTGNILPGHGGVMDRLDGLVLTAPLAAIITYFAIAHF